MTDSSGWDTYPYRVVSARLVTPVVRELWLAPVEAPLPYQPGQYALLCDAQRAVPQRSYSMANAPRSDGWVSLLVTLVDGGPTSTWAHELSVHDEVLLEGPYGTFVTDPGSRSPVLLLGAGSGLAPVRALAEALLDPASPLGVHRRPVTLYFSGRTAADLIDRARLEALADALPRFEYVVTCTREAPGKRHRHVPELLADDIETLSGTEVFAAGPPGFVAGCAQAARHLGAADADIRTEEFFVDPH